MELAIEIEFPYVRQAGKPEQQAATLKLPYLEQMVPLKIVAETLGLDWATQHSKVKAKSIDDSKMWEVRLIKLAAGGGAKSQVCVAIRTLQVFLDGLNLKKVKDPELVKHFQAHLVPTIFAHLQRIGEAMLPQENESEGHVIHVNRPFDPVDRMRRVLSDVMSPDDLNFALQTNSFRLGVWVETTTIRGGKKKDLKLMAINDVNNDNAVTAVRQLIVDNKGEVLTPRDLYTEGYDRTNAVYKVPARTYYEQVGHTLTSDGLIPKDAVIEVRKAAELRVAPWAAAAA